MPHEPEIDVYKRYGGAEMTYPKHELNGDGLLPHTRQAAAAAGEGTTGRHPALGGAEPPTEP